MEVSVDNLIQWINHSGLFQKDGENIGGVHSYFDQNSSKFGFLYPEITGYFISSQRFLYKITNDKQLIDNAVLSSEWLIKIYEKHGGIVQGLGQALQEHTVYDEESGQLLTASFMDYTLPRAGDLPYFEFNMRNVRCKTNPLGIKGSGEAGAIGAPPSVINAIIYPLLFCS